MLPLAGAAAVAILIGTAIVLRAGRAWTILAGTTLVAMATPISGEAPPALAAVAFRVVAAILAFYAASVLLRASGGPRSPEPSMPLGGLADTAFAAVGLGVGLAATNALRLDAVWLGAAATDGPAVTTALADPLPAALAVALGVAALDLLAFAGGPARSAAGGAFALLAAELAVRGGFGVPDALTEAAATLAVAGAVVVGALVVRAVGDAAAAPVEREAA